MFNLEQAIAEWRHQMLSAGIQSPVPLEELEIHLREETEQQMSAGLNAEKAFESAVQKIGRPDALKAEFAKTGGVVKSTQRKRRLIGFIPAGVIIPLCSYVIFKNEMSLGWRLAGLANLAVIVLSVPCWRRLNQIFPVIPDQRKRLAIGLAGAALGMVGMIVFMNFILPHFEFTEGQLGVIVFWGLTVMAAFGGVASGLEEAARKQRSTTD